MATNIANIKVKRVNQFQDGSYNLQIKRHYPNRTAISDNPLV